MSSPLRYLLGVANRRLVSCSASLSRLNARHVCSRYTNRIAVTRYLPLRCMGSSTNGIELPEEIIKMPLETYHRQSDIFLEQLLEKLEDISDKHPNEVPDVELSQGVMTLVIPQYGTYVINKQPPNKQIWLASPVSGPNRFDLHHGEWISLRDGTKLLDILTKEIGDAIPSGDIDMNV